jgi:hypothetical protein
MAAFKYRALDASGKIVKGVLEVILSGKFASNCVQKIFVRSKSALRAGELLPVQVAHKACAGAYLRRD